MRSTQLIFHVMFAVSVVITAAGIVLGTEARLSDHEADAGSRHSAATSRAPLLRVATEQAVVPPLPLAPRFGAEVVGPPCLSWHLETGTDGARVELSPTSDFDEATLRRIDVRGERVVLPAPWPAGTWYWRLRGRQGAVVGDRATPTWMVYVADGTTPS